MDLFESVMYLVSNVELWFNGKKKCNKVREVEGCRFVYLSICRIGESK